MRHSIVLWDCSFREFFHTVDSLSRQEFPTTEFEVIIIEQRSEEFSNSQSRRRGNPNLSELVREFQADLQIEIKYMGDPESVPFHWGRIVNRGLEVARGEYISVMDADLLLEKDFLRKLDRFSRESQGAVINLFRHMAERPVGVDHDHWKEQEIDFYKCLSVCPTRHHPIPHTVSNKGPLISASSEVWRQAGGYDEHLIWSTGISRLGQDVNARLELQTGNNSAVLPNTFAVHPWHPEGFFRDTFASVRLLELQNGLIEWARENEEPRWTPRLPLAERTYLANQALIDRLIHSSLGRPGETDLQRQGLHSGTGPSWFELRLQRDRLLGKLYRKYLSWVRQ